MNTKNSQENENPMEIMSNDESEEIIDPIAMKSISKALQIIDHVMRFYQQHWNKELDQSLMKVTEKVQDIQIANEQQQNLTNYTVFFIRKPFFCLSLNFLNIPREIRLRFS